MLQMPHNKPTEWMLLSYLPEKQPQLGPLKNQTWETVRGNHLNTLSFHPLDQWISKWGPATWQWPHHLGTCWATEFWPSEWEAQRVVLSNLCVNKSPWFWWMLKFESHQVRFPSFIFFTRQLFPQEDGSGERHLLAIRAGSLQGNWPSRLSGLLFQKGMKSTG